MLGTLEPCHYDEDLAPESVPVSDMTDVLLYDLLLQLQS